VDYRRAERSPSWATFCCLGRNISSCWDSRLSCSRTSPASFALPATPISPRASAYGILFLLFAACCYFPAVFALPAGSGSRLRSISMFSCPWPRRPWALFSSAHVRRAICSHRSPVVCPFRRPARLKSLLCTPSTCSLLILVPYYTGQWLLHPHGSAVVAFVGVEHCSTLVRKNSIRQRPPVS